MSDKARKYMPWVCAGVISAVVILGAILAIKGTDTGKQGHDIVVFGDSIIAYSQDELSVANMIAENTGLDVYDLSFGGTLMSYRAADETLAACTNNLCMAAISKAILADDYALQINNHTTDSATDYFEERIRGFETLDLSNTDIVMIEQCINDYNCAVPIGDADSESEYTYCGAMKMVVNNIRRANPDIRIIILSPTMKWIDENTKAIDVDYGGGTYEEYVSAQRSMAERLGVEYIDLTHIYDEPWEMQELTVCGYEYTVDGTHPNVYGRRMIAAAVDDYLKGIVK